MYNIPFCGSEIQILFFVFTDCRKLKYEVRAASIGSKFHKNQSVEQKLKWGKWTHSIVTFYLKEIRLSVLKHCSSQAQRGQEFLFQGADSCSHQQG